MKKIRISRGKVALILPKFPSYEDFNRSVIRNHGRGNIYSSQWGSISASSVYNKMKCCYSKDRLSYSVSDILETVYLLEIFGFDDCS